MKAPRIADRQLDLLAERLAAIGVGRREFLRVAAGLAAMGAAGFSPRSSTCASAAAAGIRTTPPAMTSTRTSTAAACSSSSPVS
jgi:hypothetical protein